MKCGYPSIPKSEISNDKKWTPGKIYVKAHAYISLTTIRQYYGSTSINNQEQRVLYIFAQEKSR